MIIWKFLIMKDDVILYFIKVHLLLFKGRHLDTSGVNGLNRLTNTEIDYVHISYPHSQLKETHI